jgi:acetylornithine aminotransferase
LVAAQLVDGLDARAVAAAALRRGLVVNAVTPSALRLAPSLLVTDDEIAEATEILSAAYDDVTNP